VLAIVGLMLGGACGANPVATEPNEAAVAGVTAVAVSTTLPPVADSADSRPTDSLTPAPGATETTMIQSGSEPPADWVRKENARPGTEAWRVTNQTTLTFIEGYSDVTSAAPGQTVTLFTNTESDRWRMQVYRLGWYGGTRGRLVSESEWVKGVRQVPHTYDKSTGLAEARWQPTLRFVVPADWLTGTYLFKLVTDDGAQYQLPFTVRNDSARDTVMLVNAVTTWQAYNGWGGCSLYECRGDRSRARANVVSFDRPYDRAYHNGSADLLDHELSLIALAEQMGLSVSYVTDVDLHERPELMLAQRAVLSLGHDEYYTTQMRRTLEAARDRGVNLAFLGANAVYRKIRLEPSWDGRANRREVNYRSDKDPGTKGVLKETTVEWRKAPVSEPEARLIGVQYACANVDAPLKVTAPNHWLMAGTGVRDGQLFESLVGNEFDQVADSSPKNIDVLARSPVKCNASTTGTHNMTYYSHSSGAGVFATGTIWWICAIDSVCSVPANEKFVRQVTENMLRVFAAGPAGLTHPSGASGR
jgi:hypothetical protein